MPFCKFFQHELDEGSPVCPACGRDNAAEELTPAVPEAEAPAEVTQPLTGSAPADAAAPDADAAPAADAGTEPPDAAEADGAADANEAAPADGEPGAEAASDAADGADAPLDENTPAYFTPPEKKKRSTGALVAIFIAVAVVVGAIVYIALNLSLIHI